MKISGYRRRTWVTINLNNATHNFKEIKSLVKSKICCVIKGNAYGHGAIELASLYQNLGADFLAVSNIEEALQLRKNNITLPILILGYTPPECALELSRHDISQTVYSFEYAKELIRYAESYQVSVKVHIKIDSGMSRIGFKTDILSLNNIVTVCNSSALISEGIFTHFSAADLGKEGREHTNRQYEMFQHAIKYLHTMGVSFHIKHCSNSAAVFDYPEYQLDMVRVGIALYGLYPSGQTRHTIALRKVMTLTSVISHVKEIASGDAISYGGTFVATQPMKVATVPIGYADGFWRSNSNMHYALKLNDHYAPILGRICMDQLMIDVTDIDCNIGDEVLIFGDDDICSATKIAEANNTIDYEVVCAIGNRVPRFFIKDGTILSVRDLVYDCEV